MLSSLKFLATFRLILLKKNHLKIKILIARTKKKTVYFSESKRRASLQLFNLSFNMYKVTPAKLGKEWRFFA